MHLGKSAVSLLVLLRRVITKKIHIIHQMTHVTKVLFPLIDRPLWPPCTSLRFQSRANCTFSGVWSGLWVKSHRSGYTIDGGSRNWISLLTGNLHLIHTESQIKIFTCLKRKDFSIKKLTEIKSFHQSFFLFDELLVLANNRNKHGLFVWWRLWHNFETSWNRFKQSFIKARKSLRVQSFYLIIFKVTWMNTTLVRLSNS